MSVYQKTLRRLHDFEPLKTGRHLPLVPFKYFYLIEYR